MALSHYPIMRGAAGGAVKHYGLIFRETLGGITYPPGTAWAGFYAYPSQEVRDQIGDQDFNVGYVLNGPKQSANRTATNPRLAGRTNTSGGDNRSTYRINVTGTVGWNVAFGDTNWAIGVDINVFDGDPDSGGTLVYDFSPGATEEAKWIAADNVLYNEADWTTADEAKTSWRTDVFVNYMFFRFDFNNAVLNYNNETAYISVEFTA